MDKNDIINYVMKTPENTNPAILGEMLDLQNSNKKNVTIVTVTIDPPTNTYTCDKTFQELVELYSQGAFLVLKEVSTISAMPDQWAYLEQFVHSAFVFKRIAIVTDDTTITSIYEQKYQINDDGLTVRRYESPRWKN